MVQRLIGTIVGLVVIAFFVGFNLQNRCNVSVVFHTFEDVPVFITILVSFIAGALFTMPFAFLFHAGRKAGRSGVQGAASAGAEKKTRFPFGARKVSGGTGARVSDAEDGAGREKKAASVQAAEQGALQENALSDGARKDGASAAERDA